MIKQPLADLLGKLLSELNSHYPAKMISFTWSLEMEILINKANVKYMEN